jgi:predicted hotdog family 3-hydroxylacyl-ACP dehydratase
VTNLRSWAKRWNDASLRQIAIVREPSPSRRWPLVGMFAIGLVAGAIGSYAVAQRSQVKHLVRRALLARREVLGEFGGVEAAKPVSVTSHRSNHRRKAAVEVT